MTADFSITQLELRHHPLVNRFQKSLAGIQHLLADLGLKVFLKFVEGRIDLRLVTCRLHDLKDATLDVNAAFNCSQDFVARTKNALEQVEFFTEQFIDALLGSI